MSIALITSPFKFYKVFCLRFSNSKKLSSWSFTEHVLYRNDNNNNNHKLKQYSRSLPDHYYDMERFSQCNTDVYRWLSKAPWARSFTCSDLSRRPPALNVPMITTVWGRFHFFLGASSSFLKKRSPIQNASHWRRQSFAFVDGSFWLKISKLCVVINNEDQLDQ